MAAVSDTSQRDTPLAEPAARAVPILDADPDLAGGIAPTEVGLASAASVAPVHEFGRGPWTYQPPPDPGGLGGLVLSGLIIVRVEVAERWHAELLGEGDLISPWLPAASELADVSARILEPVEVAVLDRQFALRTARWPEIHAGLMRRLIARSRRLSLQSAINSIPRTQERLELTLWQFANRFGRVALGGLRLPCR